MKNERENSIVHLTRSGAKPPPTRIMQHNPSLQTSGAIRLSSAQPTTIGLPRRENDSVRSSARPDLTPSNFFVTRARAHAQVRASAYAYAHAQKDEGGLKRVLDAALRGENVRVASIAPASLLVRICASLLIPAMLIMPLAPAYANEAPLADRVASDVAAIVGNTNIADAAAPVSAESNVAAVGDTTTSAPTTTDVPLTPSTSASESTTSTSIPEVSVSPDPTSTSTSTPDTSSSTPTSSGGGSAASSGASEVSTSSASISTSTATTTLATENSTQTDTFASTTANEVTPILDVAPEAATENLDALRARVRDELRGEVKNEVRREVEEEVYRGCKNLDGTGYYCIPNAKSFGSPVISNERAISVVVQPDAVTGNKQIFLVRGTNTIQISRGTDDNVFPMLDPSGDLLVWQSMQGGHWQIAYVHVADVGVPTLHYLTKGENNFNPKVYAGRIVWQAWVDGNWEIFTAIAAPQKIPDESLSAEHRAVGIDGDWEVKRITANNAPDMFPGVNGDTVTWQAIDGGVWQVFAYDLKTGTSHRVSKPGVKSESPRVALVWNEEDKAGQMHMVGSGLDGKDAFDITALARRLVNNTREQPKSPVSNTEIVVVAPTVVRTESEASTTPVLN